MEFNFTRYNYHSGTEALVETLANRANTTDKHFIRTVVLFYLSIITSTMRNRIVLAGNRPVPLNIYALALAGSGAGKGIIMGNAPDSLINKLPHLEVIETNDEDGVAKYLSKIFL
jgi:hypothetical protein